MGGQKMHRSFFRFGWGVAVLVILAGQVGTVPAQDTEPSNAPEVGQEGKDVIWVPTKLSVVNKMLDMAKVTSKDYVIDLGSGDGRTVIAAAKRGARALGIEYNPELVELSKQLAATEGVSDLATFVKADLFESDFSEATVITMFLLPKLNLQLRPRILDLKPGTRVVSNSFDMGEWQADETADVTEFDEIHTDAYLWIVPAKVAGTWQMPRGQLALTQTFQTVSGTLTSAGRKIPITNGRLRGDRLFFRAGDEQFAGRVKGETIRGEMTKTWTARKKRDPT